MALTDKDKIDFVGLDAFGVWVLTISDHLEWKGGQDDLNHIHLLQEKINLYMSYIEDGLLYEDFKDAVGGNLLIQVMSKHIPPQSTNSFFEVVRETLESIGVHFRQLQVDES